MGIEDRDGYREARRRPQGRRDGVLHAWWQRALVSAVVLMAAATVAWSVRVWMVERAFDHMHRSVRGSTAKMQRQAHATSERLLVDQRWQQALREAQDRLRRQALADADGERARVYRQEVAERERRERAWADFYKTPALCDGPYDKIDLMDCANRHIRAKKAFEAAYAAGRL